jgi:intein-encoded DNA endonuclease-like protein
MTIILKDLTVDERVGLYHKALELRDGGDCLTTIGNKLDVHLGTVSRWLNGLKSPMGKLHYVELSPSASLAWLVGLLLGDGSARIKKHKDGNYHAVQLQMAGKNLRLVEKSAEIVGEIFGKRPPIYHWSHPLADEKLCGWEICSKQFYEYLLPMKRGTIDKKITDEYPMDFLAGLYEAEGWITIDRRGYKEIGLRNSDQSLLRLVSILLALRGWHCGIYQNGDAGEVKMYRGHVIRATKPCFQLEIHRQDEIARFLQDTGLEKEEKWSVN